MALSIMTYNILNGGISREEMILDIFRVVKPYVAILEEVYNADIVQYLANSLKKEFFFGRGNAKRHVAILSQFPITFARSHYPFPPISRNVIEAEIEYRPGKKR